MFCFSSVGLFGRRSSLVSSQSHESVPPSSPSRMGLDRTTSHSSEASAVSEAARNLPTSPSSLVVKEEPYDMDDVMIKWEMSEEHPGTRGSPCGDDEGQSVKGTVSHPQLDVTLKYLLRLFVCCQTFLNHFCLLKYVSQLVCELIYYQSADLRRCVFNPAAKKTDE